MIELIFYCELSFQILKQHEGKQFLHEIFKDYLYIFNQFYQIQCYAWLIKPDC